MNNKYTPSPWLFRGKSSEVYSKGKYPYTYGDMLLKFDEGYNEEFMPSDANLCLILAAPDLLEALEDCIDYGSMTGDDWIMEKALKAIKKAKEGY